MESEGKQLIHWRRRRKKRRSEERVIVRKKRLLLQGYLLVLERLFGIFDSLLEALVLIPQEGVALHALREAILELQRLCQLLAHESL